MEKGESYERWMKMRLNLKKYNLGTDIYFLDPTSIKFQFRFISKEKQWEYILRNKLRLNRERARERRKDLCNMRSYWFIAEILLFHWLIVTYCGAAHILNTKLPGMISLFKKKTFAAKKDLPPTKWSWSTVKSNLQWRQNIMFYQYQISTWKKKPKQPMCLKEQLLLYLMKL